MDGKKPYLVAILVQSIYTGMFLLSKAAFNGGMNNFVFIFYRQAVSTIFLAPVALVFEWKKAPSLSFRTFLKIFMLSLMGITSSLDLYGVALVYTSATLAAATTNCLPVITFFLALLQGMESLKLRTKPGMAKLAGIIVCLAGTATLAFYKGPRWELFCHHHSNVNVVLQHQNRHVSSGKSWIKGVFIMLTSNTLFGLWLVLQTRVLKGYPSILLFTTLQCFSSTIQSFVVAIAFVRNLDEWRLGWNVRLVAVAYCGIMVTGVSFYLQSWVVEKKGPVFLAMSTPLALIFTTLSSAILLCEIISLGSVLGGILLVAGLYSVLWGKSREEKISDIQHQCLEANKAGDQDLELACK